MAKGRPREFDRDQALQSAMLVFWRKGFFATSMTDLCDAMGIASPSLYAAFGSKEDLYVESVEHYSRTFGSLLWDCLDSGPTVRGSVKNMLLQAAKGLRKSAKCPGGCMVNLATLDEDMQSPIPTLLKKTRRGQLERIRARLEVAAAQGELPDSANLNHLARFYMGMIQSIAIQARDGATLAELEGVVEVAMTAWPTNAGTRLRQ